ncbi:MAG: hypothetical protein IIB37_03220 [Gemmatimonadetes bacterium]|nr:hypothetical protein [Gemmatimonadota bacterium]
MTHGTGAGEAPAPQTLGRAWIRRSGQALGAVLIVLAFVPVYRLMDTSGDAPHRRVSVEVAEVTLQLAWWGTIVTLLLAFLFARVLPGGGIRKMGRVFVAWLSKPSAATYALILSGLSFGLSVLTGRFLYQGLFTNVDEMASALHARYLANGLLAGPIADAPEAWLIPNTFMVAEGWVSHFPPGHLLAMAALIRVGVPMLLGPISAGVLAGLIALSLPRLLPGNPGAARVASLLVAVAPFVVLLGGGSMSHVSAGAFGAAVLYAALRARDGQAWWGVAAGAAVGLMVSDRPLIGLVLGIVFTFGLWGPAALGNHGHGRMWFLRRVGATLLGGAPFAVFLGWFNQRLYGNPFTLGYVAAFGDRHRLGFHVDPWGYPYSIREALAFTSSDMLSWGIQLLETPFPITAVIGLYLLLTPRLPNGVGVLVAWAVLPVVANGYYWFHDVRMLFEAGPAWIALAVIAALELAGASGGDVDGYAPGPGDPGGGRPDQGPPRGGQVSDRRGWAADMAMWTIVFGVVYAVAWGAPTRWGSYRWSEETLQRITVPSLPTQEPAIVFVHTSWNERLSSRLQGAGGMRQDSVITALRRSTNCELHRYTLARVARAAGAPDIEPPPSSPGAALRTAAPEPFGNGCIREINADRYGTVALAPLIWQGDLPGLEEGRPMFVRDFGPELNRRLLEAYPERQPFVFVPKDPNRPPEIVPYAEAMAQLWGVVRAVARP